MGQGRLACRLGVFAAAGFPPTIRQNVLVLDSVIFVPGPAAGWSPSANTSSRVGESVIFTRPSARRSRATTTSETLRSTTFFPATSTVTSIVTGEPFGSFPSNAPMWSTL